MGLNRKCLIIWGLLCWKLLCSSNLRIFHQISIGHCLWKHVLTNPLFWVCALSPHFASVQCLHGACEWCKHQVKQQIDSWNKKFTYNTITMRPSTLLLSFSTVFQYVCTEYCNRILNTFHWQAIEMGLIMYVNFELLWFEKYFFFTSDGTTAIINVYGLCSCLSEKREFQYNMDLPQYEWANSWLIHFRIKQVSK